ncbi:MAG: ATP-dependent helicase, partial [Planctomycetes bacterium]|nr:ATP-dependent helicase [Planctomycetota bacterium]
VRERCHRKYRYILVDEYQDTNGCQYRFLSNLVNPCRNLCVVGDDDQSIYGFRGADRQKILKFAQDFNGAHVVKLEENYRSTMSILRLANAVISENVDRHEKSLRSQLGPGAPVRWLTVADEVAEAEYVAGEIDLLRRDPKTKHERIAVLMRSAQQARPLEEKLRLRRIPYQLVGGPSFFDRKEIRDALAYWRVAANPKDDLSLLRIINVPRRGFGKKTLEKLDEVSRQLGSSLRESLGRVATGEGEFSNSIRVAAGHLDRLFTAAEERLQRRAFSEMAREILNEASYQEVVDELYTDPLTREARWGAVDELCRGIDAWQVDQPEESFDDFLAALSLDEKNADDAQSTGTADLMLMTLHSAKGLEFHRVFLLGVEEDILPHRKSVAEGDRAIDEERRLFYVGITRAQQHLVLTQASFRTLYGQLRPRQPSRFLKEVEPHGLFVHEEGGSSGAVGDDATQDYVELYKRITKQRPSGSDPSYPTLFRFVRNNLTCISIAVAIVIRRRSFSVVSGWWRDASHPSKFQARRLKKRRVMCANITHSAVSSDYAPMRHTRNSEGLRDRGGEPLPLPVLGPWPAPLL